MSFFDIFAKVLVFLAWPQKFYNQPLLDLVKLFLSQNYFLEKDVDNSDEESIVGTITASEHSRLQFIKENLQDLFQVLRQTNFQVPNLPEHRQF